MSPHLLAISSGGALVDLDGTFFVQFALFIFMFIFLYLALFRPMIRLIEARREATEGTKERAIAMRKEAEGFSDEVDRQILDIQSAAILERDRMIEQARRRDRDLMTAAREKSNKVAQNAREQIKRDGEMVRKELEVEVEALAAGVATRILRQSFQENGNSDGSRDS